MALTAYSLLLLLHLHQHWPPISAAVLVVNDEFVRDLGSLELGDVPHTEYDAVGFTVIVVLEIDCFGSFSASVVALIDSSSAKMRSNLVLQTSGSA